MNKVIILGRLTSKPELRYTTSNTAYTRFRVAVNRSFTNEDGKRDADFINVISWRKQAETVCKYFDKGSQIAIEGRLQSGNYEDEDGNKRSSLDVVLENFEFVDSKKKETSVEVEPVTDEPDPFAEFGEEISIEGDFLE